MTLGALIRSAEEGCHLSNILYRIFCLYAGNRLQALDQSTKLTVIARDVPTPSGHRLRFKLAVTPWGLTTPQQLSRGW